VISPVQRRLQQAFGQLLQHTALSRQLQATGPGPVDQLADQPLVQAVQASRYVRVLSVFHARHHLGHQCRFHHRELHERFTVPMSFGDDLGQQGCTCVRKVSEDGEGALAHAVEPGRLHSGAGR
jgi:hypothetical protein